MIKKLLSVLMFLLTVPAVQAQQPEVESAMKILHSSTRDSAKYVACLSLAFYYAENEYDSAFIYINKGMALAKKLDVPICEAMILSAKGYVYMKQSKFDESLKTFQQSFSIAEGTESGNSRKAGGISYSNGQV